MGNQCCQGNSGVDGDVTKNQITMGNPKDGLSNSDSGKTLSNDKDAQTKGKEDEAKQLNKQGKSINYHNSKEDYQFVDDRHIGSLQNNGGFDDQYSSQRSNIDKNGPQKFGTKEVGEKQVIRAGSGVMAKGNSLRSIQADQADNAMKDPSQQQLGQQLHHSVQSKDAASQSSKHQNSASRNQIPNGVSGGGSTSNGTATDLRQKKPSIGGTVDKVGGQSNSSTAGRPPTGPQSSGQLSQTQQQSQQQLQQQQQPQSNNKQPLELTQPPQLASMPPRGSSPTSGLPPSPNPSNKSKKPESGTSGTATTPGTSTNATSNTNGDQNKKPTSSPTIEQKKKMLQEQKSDENSSTKRNFSADSFIHMKQGTFSQQYKVGEILGEGAFGQVSKVIHKNTAIVRAMKTIKKSGIIKEEEDRLFSEMNILKNLDHPNILRLIELYQDSKNYYLITEYCSGGELFDKIKSMTNFTEKIAADYMKQILSAVVYCHQKNIVHRDLKPENLLFDTDKKNANIKVIDFGTSRKLDKNKKMSKRLGTPYYIAPEVLEQNYDEKCDVWSCGVILYILLCGYPPFGGRSEDEILKKVRAGKFKFEPEDWERISEDAKNLIRRMLTIDPKNRPSAEQSLADPWIQKNAPSNHISTRALNNLSSFQTRSKLKQAILTFIVSQVVSQNDKEELQKTFRQLDRNGDGTLSKEELVEGYTAVIGDRDKAILHVEKIFDEVDFNRSGKVDFTEFLMAASNKEILLSKAKIEQAFKIFDQDGNGNITQEELSYIMGDIPDDFWKEILDECDTNKDGMIQQNEFIDLLLKKKIPL